jgi:hypothetical protein
LLKAHALKTAPQSTCFGIFWFLPGDYFFEASGRGNAL